MFFCFIGMFILSSVGKNVDYLPNGLPPNGLVISALPYFYNSQSTFGSKSVR